MVKKKEIKYIGFYDSSISSTNRSVANSGMNKMNYICEALNNSHHDVHIISPAWIIDSKSKTEYKRTSTTQLKKGIKLTLGPSFSTSYKWSRNLKIIVSLMWLFYWLIKNAKPTDKILVYSAPWFFLPIHLAKIIKRFTLVLEVEEIYSSVWQLNTTMQKWEKKLISIADYYIAVSDVLAEILGKKTKIVVYGSYSISKENPTIIDPSTISVIYAGSIDFTKGGAYQAVQCANFLPNNYVIHICGPGSKQAIQKLVNDIEIVNKSLGRKACIYHGLLPNNEFDDLLNSCQIAINPQFNGENMRTLFPSKILKYFAHNLRVVSTKIESVEKSKIASIITFSENDTSEANAKAILTIDLSKPYNSTSILKELDKGFKKDLISLFT